MKYNDDDYSQGYGLIKQTFKALTQHDILEPYIKDNDFILSNDGKKIGYDLYVFDIRYLKKFESVKPIK